MRTFQDRNFLVWEAYPSGGPHGFSDNAHIIFHCVTQEHLRSRFVGVDGDNSDAERTVREATTDELLRLLESAPEID